MLRITNLTVAYGQSRILQDVSLAIPDRDVVCLLGRNGVGKTTLLKTIIGLLHPRAGAMTFESQNLLALAPHLRARAGIGYVPQGRGIFPYLSVHENLLMGLERARRHDRAALDAMYDQFPVLKRMTRRMAGVLSGGQQQQLAIARALVSRPRLLLLDEPTEGIQPSIVSEIEEVIVRLRESGTVAILLVEQFLDFALRAASSYYIMEKGSIVAQGLTRDMHQATVQQ